MRLTCAPAEIAAMVDYSMLNPETQEKRMARTPLIW